MGLSTELAAEQLAIITGITTGAVYPEAIMKRLSVIGIGPKMSVVGEGGRPVAEVRKELPVQPESPLVTIVG